MHDTSSSKNSDISSAEGDLLPDEEQDLRRSQQLIYKLTNIYVEETGNPAEPFCSSVSRIIQLSQSVHSLQDSNVSQHFSQQRSPRIISWAASNDSVVMPHLRENSEGWSTSHRRTFSFVPGDDAVKSGSPQARGPHASAQPSFSQSPKSQAYEHNQTLKNKQDHTRRTDSSALTREDSNTSKATVISTIPADRGKSIYNSALPGLSDDVKKKRVTDKTFTGSVAAAVNAAAKYAPRSSASLD